MADDDAREDARRHRPPRQERSRRTVEAIVEAAARILDETSFERTSTNRIARVAGVGIGSLYQYFPGKDAIAESLVRRLAADDLARLRANIAATRGEPLEARLEAVIRLGFEPIATRPRLFVFVFTHLPALGLLPVARALERDVAEEVRRLFDEHRDELPGVDTRIASVVSIGGLRGALIALSHQAPEALEQTDRLADMLVDVMLGYIARSRART